MASRIQLHRTIRQTMPAFRPVLFLDFDGVTHPDRAPRERYFEAVPLIEAVLRAYPEVDIVLSTTWRTKYPIDELRHLFSHDIAERIIGMTPNYAGERSWPELPFERAARARHAEIQVWLHENRTIDHPWLALDDRPWWFNAGAPVLATDMNNGFTSADAITLRSRLEALRRRCRFGEILNIEEACEALGGISTEELDARTQRGQAYRVPSGYPAIQTWPGIAGEPLARCVAELSLGGRPPDGSGIDRFFTGLDAFLGDLTPVEALLGRLLSARQVGGRAQELLEEPPERRLMAVLMASSVSVRHYT